MRYLIFFLMLDVVSGQVFGKSKTKELDTNHCLEISGRVSNFTKGRNLYKVELISCNKIVDSVFIRGRSDFRFALERGTHYAIRISCPGYITRLVSVFTNVSLEKNAFYRFEFDTQLISTRDAKRLDDDALDFPIAIISYHHDFNNFYYSEEYTSSVKRQLYLRQSF
jgi:hypothetical protein